MTADCVVQSTAPTGATFMALTGGSLRPALAVLAGMVDLLRPYLGTLAGHVAVFSELVNGVRGVFVTGRGVSLATAGAGGLILKESTRQYGEGMSCAAFAMAPSKWGASTCWC